MLPSQLFLIFVEEIKMEVTIDIGVILRQVVS